MIVRGPGIPRGAKVATPTTNPDVAVTIAAIADARPGRVVDGVNMLDYWRADTDYDRVVPIEAYPVMGGRGRIYSGIRYGRFTYVKTRTGQEVSSTGPRTRVSCAPSPSGRGTPPPCASCAG